MADDRTDVTYTVSGTYDPDLPCRGTVGECEKDRRSEYWRGWGDGFLACGMFGLLAAVVAFFVGVACG